MELDFELNIMIATMARDNSILGQTCFHDMIKEFWIYDKQSYTSVMNNVQRQTIIFDECLYNLHKSRFRFTAAHELAHWILHQRFYSNYTSIACRSTNETLNNRKDYYPKTADDWTEWQANQFAAAILLPRNLMDGIVDNFITGKNLSYEAFLSDFPYVKEL
ncbi:MAG: ImmA/IrrE family metallo-endopeptidase, partial [Oscillospiraceae bacterium]|nr:ImmA/IrrE family metallo-endopeptidase [Oscillospiraceae bacterium]